MDLKLLFSLFEKEEERRFQEVQDDPDFFGYTKEKNKYLEGFEDFKSLVKNHEFGKTSETGENLDAIKKYNLSLEEAAIIYLYTGHDICFDVNSQLRNHSAHLDKDIEEYAKLLNQSLDKLPSFDNGLVYRDIQNISNAKELIDYYSSNIGKVVCESAFISSHIEYSRWSDVERSVQLIIKTKKDSNGKDLRELSFNSTETEVLFKNNAKFIVVNIHEHKNIVELIEV